MMRYLLPLLLFILTLGCGGPSPQSGGLDGPARRAELKYPAAPPGSQAAAAATDTTSWLDRTMRDLRIRLKLTPELAAKVRSILKESEEQKERLRPEGDRYGSIQAMNKLFARMRQVDSATEASLAKVLSTDQMVSYRAYRKDQRERLSEGRPLSESGPSSGRDRKRQ
ncbi:MAG: hypothetical protein C4525_12220 [Desulfarculus sp.]|jgi:hypothetical protein|nr:MAG: hypothetical protein C4525_12220 [Desulfarculus sp.]